MNELLETCVIMLFFLELFELYWQRGNTFRQYLISLFYFYKKSVILFISLHPSFYFVIFSMMLFNNTSFLATSIIIVKMLDIGFKLTLLDRLSNEKPLGFFAPLANADYPLPFGLKLIPALLYPLFFYYAFSWQKGCYLYRITTEVTILSCKLLHCPGKIQTRTRILKCSITGLTHHLPCL